MRKTLKGKLTISRAMSNREDDYVEIRIEDEVSGVEFVSINLSMEQYGHAVAGTSYQSIEYTARDMDCIGKVKEREAARVPIPSPLAYNRQGAEEYVKANFQREGWILDSYLGSQNSITGTGVDYYANISYYRYVEQQ